MLRGKEAERNEKVLQQPSIKLKILELERHKPRLAIDKVSKSGIFQPKSGIWWEFSKKPLTRGSPRGQKTRVIFS
jgi:hypothetical protein